MSKRFDANIPVLQVKGKSLAEAWEKAVLVLYKEGCKIKTQYDKPEDPPSIDATMTIVVEDPSSEPKIHKCFPGGLEDLQEYKMEVVEGIKDSWIRKPTNPLDTKWEYTYHGRLFKREMPITEAMKYIASMSEELKKELLEKGVRVLLDMPWVEKKKRKVGDKLEDIVVINQIECCIDMLSKFPYTRRAQAITWQPEEDLVSYDPACLQNMWFRMLKGDDGIYRLNMNLKIRSNDAYGASFMNMFGFTSVDEYVAEGVSKKRGEIIKLGRYVHQADSFHIYGKDLEEFKQRLVNRLGTTTFEERTFRSDDSLVKQIMEEARPKILEKVRKQTEQSKSEGIIE